MTWIVQWDGRDFDVDPSEFTAAEMAEIKRRTGLTYPKILEGLSAFDGETIQALFWTVERRARPELKFSDYIGPPLRVVITQMAGFLASVEDLGKALPSAPNGVSGFPGSPNGSATAPTSSTG